MPGSRAAGPGEENSEICFQVANKYCTPTDRSNTRRVEVEAFNGSRSIRSKMDHGVNTPTDSPVSRKLKLRHANGRTDEALWEEQSSPVRPRTGRIGTPVMEA